MAADFSQQEITETNSSATGPKAKRVSNRGVALATLLPLGTVLALFFLIPIVGMAITSFQDGTTGDFTWANYEAMTEGNRAQALLNSLLVSLYSSSIALAAGTLIAFCISFLNSKILNSITAVVSSVLANSGGAPLAFSFIVLAGNTGYLISMLLAIDSSFSLYTVKGLVLMYQYFLIPMVVLLLLPSFQAMRTSWKEANTSLGGSAWTFWRRVGLSHQPFWVCGFWSSALLLPRTPHRQF